MPTTTTLQQTAQKLGISMQTLREYLAAKSAEVAPRQIPPMQRSASGK